jgi:hypothetical protein
VDIVAVTEGLHDDDRDVRQRAQVHEIRVVGRDLEHQDLSDDCIKERLP